MTNLICSHNVTTTRADGVIICSQCGSIRGSKKYEDVTRTVDQLTLTDLKEFFDFNKIKTEKIRTIKLIRKTTGVGLLEAKEFYEDVIERAVSGRTPLGMEDTGYEPSIIPVQDTDQIGPPMFLIGHTYKQVDKTTVLIVGASNQNTSYETVYSISSEGRAIHRYNRRDFGRCTGTDHNNPDPRNLITL